MKHSCYMNYEVEVEFSNVTSKELGEILALDLGEMKAELDYYGDAVPKIDRMYEYYDDGWREPIPDLWQVTYKVTGSGRIPKDSLKFHDEKALNKEIDLAEEVAKYIRWKLNLTEEES